MAASFVTGLYGSFFRRFRSSAPVWTALTLLIAGCAGGSSGRSTTEEPLSSERETAAESPQSRDLRAAPRRPLALVDGTPISTTEADGRLRELAGGVILEELALEMLLEGELRRAGLSVTEADVRREQDLLAATISEGIGAAGTDAAQAADAGAEAIHAIRRSRGLGPLRFAGLLRRNAMLRRLVEEEAAASVTDEDVDLAMTIRYGPKARVRIIVTPTQREASRLKRQLDDSPERFAELAMRHSVDASAPRGGLLAPISNVDPAYPLAMLEAIDKLTARAEARVDANPVSDVVSIPGGYALLKLEEQLQGRAPPDAASARAQMREEVVLVRERSLMEARAARLLEGADITVFDQAMHWAWQARTGQ